MPEVIRDYPEYDCCKPDHPQDCGGQERQDDLLEVSSEAVHRQAGGQDGHRLPAQGGEANGPHLGRVRRQGLELEGQGALESEKE